MLGRIRTVYGDKVRLVYKDFPLSSHPSAIPAAIAARCAGELGAYWPYHDLLFVAQPRFSREDLVQYAKRLQLPAEPFGACLDSGRHADAVKADHAEGRAAGVRGTPTFFINGRRLVGYQTWDALRTAVDAALAAESAPSASSDSGANSLPASPNVR